MQSRRLHAAHKTVRRTEATTEHLGHKFLASNTRLFGGLVVGQRRGWSNFNDILAYAYSPPLRDQVRRQQVPQQANAVDLCACTGALEQ